MLLTKVKAQKPEIPTPSVKIGTAILPTITKINMEKADPDTISEKKFDELDSLSHIKDKSDCNYCSIVAKQYELMDKIAAKICILAKAIPLLPANLSITLSSILLQRLNGLDIRLRIYVRIIRA